MTFRGCNDDLSLCYQILFIQYPNHLHTGPKYWKTARRVRAVTLGDYDKYLGSGSSGRIDYIEDEVDSDANFLPSTNKGKGKKRRSRSPADLSLPVRDIIIKMEKRLEELEWHHSADNELEKGKSTMSNMQKELVKASAKLEAIGNNLKCIICKGYLSSASVILPCCSNFGCCQACLSQWLTESSTCPHCRAAITIDDTIVFPSTKQIPSIIETLKDVESCSSEVVEQL